MEKDVKPIASILGANYAFKPTAGQAPRTNRGATCRGGLTRRRNAVEALSLVILPGMDGKGEFLDSFLSAPGRRCEVRIIRYRR